MENGASLNPGRIVPEMVFLDPKRVVAYLGIRAGMRVAEFGVGRGYYAIELARMVGAEGRVAGIDVMSGALDNLASHIQAEGLTNVDLVQANLEVLGATGLGDASQDHVLAANVLFQSDKKAEILQEARRILKPEGLLGIIDWEKGAGGLGPPDEMRTDKETMKSLVMSLGFEFVRDIAADAYHYGMIFKKS